MSCLTPGHLGVLALSVAAAAIISASRPSNAQTLGTSSEEAAALALVERLRPRHTASDQLGVIEALRPILAGPQGARLSSTVVARWLQLEPGARRKTLALLPVSMSLTDALLKSMVTQRIPLWTLRLKGRDAFDNVQDPRVRSAARRVFSAERQAVESAIRPYVALLNTPPVREDGQSIFESLCSKCHRLRGRYNGLMGPDLSNVYKQNAIEIATNILVPSDSIADGYEAYTIETRSGQRHVGTIRPADPAYLALHWNGETTVLRRDEIVSLSLLSESMMPKDLRYLMSPAELRDLIGFLLADAPSADRPLPSDANRPVS